MTKQAIRDQKAQSKSDRRDKALAHRDDEDVRYLLDRPEGRRLLWRLIEGHFSGGIGWLSDLPLNPPELAFAAIGRRQNAVELAVLVRKLRPQVMAMMEEEYLAPVELHGEAPAT